MKLYQNLSLEQPEIKEENLDTEEAPLELSEEVSAEEENKNRISHEKNRISCTNDGLH